MCKLGWIQDGSSSVAALINVTPAKAVASVNNGDPQFAQNRRTVGFPLVPVLSKAAGVPSTSSESAGTPTLTEYPPPPAFWQSRQWQNAVKTGCADDT